MVAWHEAGHALVSELLPTVDKVQKVSIVPRGKALGYTLNLPQEDRYLKSRQELIDYMKVLLAGPGLGADHLRRGSPPAPRTTSAASRRSPARWSTSTGWGPRSARTRSPPTTSRSLRRCARPRDEEVQAVAEEAYRGAEELLDRPPRPARRDRQAAAANEVIERDEIREILTAQPRQRADAPVELGEPRRRDPGRGAGQQATARAPEPPARRLRARCSG